MSPAPPNRRSSASPASVDRAYVALEFARQSEKLSEQPLQNHTNPAIQANFVTERDAVVVTADGSRLPTVPVAEASLLNLLKDEVVAGDGPLGPDGVAEKIARTVAQSPNAVPSRDSSRNKGTASSVGRSIPPSHTGPLFPPLPLYGPPSTLRSVQCALLRVTSLFLGSGFLAVIVLGSLFTSIPELWRRAWLRLTFRDPDSNRPFRVEERRRQNVRESEDRQWKRKSQNGTAVGHHGQMQDHDFVPTEGGPDPVVCDVGYYARRVGLDCEEVTVQTEDGFLIDLWHVYDPKEYSPLSAEERAHRGPELFTGQSRERASKSTGKPKFPVLLMHGLLQSAGAYCVNDDDSLAFYLCKSGYDVWLGNNRCGFRPRHVLLKPSDPRMWCWNIRQMGVLDLAALLSRVLYETGFEKAGLVCHSQGTTQTFVALAKEQRPELGERITVFAALAPAAYAGPLIGKMYFKFMKMISPAGFRVFFGIHDFVPLMMVAHATIHPKVYGWVGYRVFRFLFGWSDTNWDRKLKNRMFQFAPVHVSAESMRWWLGRECFAKHKCILSTQEELRAEDCEDAETDGPLAVPTSETGSNASHHHKRKLKGATAWYDERVPPIALWVAAKDELVDGRRLLRRLDRGREPHVQVVHSKTIPHYEHLDVIWAIDAVDTVHRELREVLWKTCNVRNQCRVPKGCADVPAWKPKVPAVGASEDLDTASDSSSSASR